ncbi:3-phosphoserine/phosphohydroxythreonine transaminase [Clostridiaceae bacterium OttesenSCG-928-D20]|nr:3-phosphoserine/phosphohydroxythreonine transaminase [Clostridiaceae bacterium OttesenSCG-928-D20]
MIRGEVFNFSAGPGVLPQQALERAGKEMLSFGETGMSVMEMSHRSKVYLDIFNSVKAKLKKILNVPDNYEILFLQGGATMQFSMTALNLMQGKSADYAVTGNFSAAAAREAEKFGRVNIAADTSSTGHTTIPSQNDLILSDAAKYFYYCSNNTIYGTEWSYVPQTGDIPLVCDMSSNILSKPIDVSDYGLIFAGAQKNMGPAGVTVVIMDKALAETEPESCPVMMSYKKMLEADSMYNTPPCYSIYMLGLVMDWIENCGGLSDMEALRNQRSGILYDFLDESCLFKANAEKSARSAMNITFKTPDASLDEEFIKAASAKGFLNLKGHRVSGGMRASCYNAMPVEGVLKLVEFMKEFEVAHRV